MFQGKGVIPALTPEVASEHKVKYEKAILVVLEGIAQVDDERVIDLYRCEGAGCEPKPKVTAARAESFRAWQRTSSSSFLSWTIFETAFCLTQRALLIYLRA